MNNNIPQISFNFKKKIKINFSGGEISSDTGLLLYKEFAEKIGLKEILSKNIKFKDSKIHRYHENIDCILQQIYSRIAGYEDNIDANELRSDPVMKEILEKETLASQPTLSRFEKIFVQENIQEFMNANSELIDVARKITEQDEVIYDIDSTDFIESGEQENVEYNGYYKERIYHPLLCFDGETADLLRGKLREGRAYTSNEVVEFIAPLIKEDKEKGYRLKLRGDSGFATPELYQECEKNQVEYYIRLKSNSVLDKLKDEYIQEIKLDNSNYQVIYGEFNYQAQVWNKARRVILKVEKKEDELFPDVTYIVTNSDISPEEGIKFYHQRSTSENFIKEGKSGFKWSRLSLKGFINNSCRFQVGILAYNLNNLMRRLTFPDGVKSFQIDTIRAKIIKIGSRTINKARNIIYKCCSSFPYKEIFFKIFTNIQRLAFVNTG